MIGLKARGLILFAVGAVALVLVACEGRGIVGITASRVPGDDAMLPDAAAALPDADVQVTSIDECLPVNPANLDPDSARALIDGVGDTAPMRFLYPYDGTVYPQGIPAPLLMWDGPASDVVYVRIHSRRFDYRGCFRPTTLNHLELPGAVWAAAVASTHGADDPFTIDLKVLSGESIHGPISEQMVIATGALLGSIYYMTTASAFSVGAVMRIRGGGPAEPFLASNDCTGCHSGSKNGTRFLAYSGGGGRSFAQTGSSASPLLAATPGAEFSGIYPDGSVYVASAHPAGVGPRSYGGGVASAGLYDTATGALLPESGVPPGAMMPSFSLDGSALVFTDHGASPGQTLSLMRFDVGTHAASDSHVLFASGGRFAGWPAFLPDGQGVVFTEGDAADFSGSGVGLHPGGLPGPATDLFVVDRATHTASLLAQAMGFLSAEDAAANRTYLPAGATDLHQNYYPTVSPAASGGYAWVFFDSARSYGNLGVHRAVWGTAVSLSSDGTYTADPSHPAFYLPGQDLATPNFRGVAVLDPCASSEGACRE